jgi:hypothetical protein
MGSFDQPPWTGWITTSGVPRPVLELQDVDRDGDLDVWGRNWDTPNPEPLLLLNDGSGVFRQQPFSLGLRGADLYYAFVDLDADGGHDVLLTPYYPHLAFVIRELGCQAATSTAW